MLPQVCSELVQKGITVNDISFLTDQKDHDYVSTIRSSLECQLCLSIHFLSLEERRQHCLSNWHKTNMQRKHNRKLPLSEEEYMNPLSEDDLVSSSDEEISAGLRSSPFVTLRINGMGVFQIYKDIFANRRSKSLFKDVLGDKSRLFNFLYAFGSSFGTSCLFVFRSGQFVITLFDNATMALIKSKSLRRYTCRKKQGGSQLIKDKQGKKISSIGSQIRRDNEKQLQTDIELLFQDLESDLTNTRLIFGSYSVYYESFIYDILNRMKLIDKLRSIPISVDSTKQEDVVKVYNEIMRVNIV